MENELEYIRNNRVFDTENIKDIALLNYFLNEEQKEKLNLCIQEKYNKKVDDILINGSKTMFGKILL